MLTALSSSGYLSRVSRHNLWIRSHVEKANHCMESTLIDLQFRCMRSTRSEANWEKEDQTSWRPLCLHPPCLRCADQVQGPARPRLAPPGPARPRLAPPGPGLPRLSPPGPALRFLQRARFNCERAPLGTRYALAGPLTRQDKNSHCMPLSHKACWALHFDFAIMENRPTQRDRFPGRGEKRKEENIVSRGKCKAQLW